MTAAPRRAVIALGGNLGDRAATLRSAGRAIAALDGVRAIAGSSLVESAAVRVDGVDHDAPAYLNAVLLIETVLAPEQLLAELNRLEAEHGRVRAERWGDRTLDLDIITMEGTLSDEPHLQLPHPRAADRAFVLAPWLQVEPDAVLPGHGRVDELLARAGDAPRLVPGAALLEEERS